MKRVKFSRVRGSMRTGTVHYQKSLLSGRKTGRGGEGKKRKQRNLLFPSPNPFRCLLRKLTSVEPLFTDTRLISTHRFLCPWEESLLFL